MDAAGSRQYPDKPAKVYLFGTCLIDLFCPQAGVDALRLLEREGIDVLFPPDQTCCGQPAHSSGFPEQARAVALAHLVHVAKVRLTDQGAPARVALHTSCAARREMGTLEHGRALLAQLSAVELAVHEHESECCGFGGTFSLKHPAISSAMAGDKVAALKETGAGSFVSADCGCMLSLNCTLQKRRDGFQGQHMASFLWQRTSGEGGQQ
jgi:L-lactate dehydrogenase complex protein LldE